MTAADYLMLISMVCIWALMAINVFLSVGGFLYYHQCSKTDGHVPIDEYPFVSIMVPAHNESVVIRRTVRALLNFDYPHDRYEIIVINRKCAQADSGGESRPQPDCRQYG